MSSVISLSLLNIAAMSLSNESDFRSLWGLFAPL